MTTNKATPLPTSSKSDSQVATAALRWVAWMPIQRVTAPLPLLRSHTSLVNQILEVNSEESNGDTQYHSDSQSQDKLLKSSFAHQAGQRDDPKRQKQS